MRGIPSSAGNIQEVTAMKRLLTCVALVGALALGARSVVAQDAMGASTTLSEAAQAAVKAAFPKATVDTVRHMGRMDGPPAMRVILSVTLTENDKKIYMVLADDGKSGKIIRVRSTISDLTTLPKPVTEAVEKVAAGAKITSAEQIEVRGNSDPPFAPLAKPEITYGVRFTPKGGDNTRMVVGADGKVISGPTSMAGQPTAS
jgi:hypothetical protein